MRVACRLRAMLRTGLIGVGKMGMSHLAIAGANPDLDVVAVCDSQGFVLSTLESLTGLSTFKNYKKMIDRERLDCVFVSTPTDSHFEIAKHAIEAGVNVFVEKPLTLNVRDSQALAQLAQAHHVANQVGYHNRFVGTFDTAQQLIKSGAIGDVHHVAGSAFGQVVTEARGGGLTWRSRKSAGGGCLHDYACHVIDLMNWLVGPPSAVVGARFGHVFSKDVEDSVHALFSYGSGATGTLDTNWSDESYRKMTTSVAVYGTLGKVIVDRQELHVFMKRGHSFEAFDSGWTTRNIVELQPSVDFYLRGEEYSSQVAAFARAALQHDSQPQNNFATAAETDWVVAAIAARAEG